MLKEWADNESLIHHNAGREIAQGQSWKALATLFLNTSRPQKKDYNHPSNP